MKPAGPAGSYAGGVETPPNVQDPKPQGWCVCGEKVTIAEAREVTLPNGRPGWEGYCPECGSPIFAIRRIPKA
jgi:hypothetical protein